MRTIDTLFELEDILTLMQYLYMDEKNYILFNNGIAWLKMYMDDDGHLMVENQSFPTAIPLSYDDVVNIPNLLGIIDELKKDTEHVKYKETFSNTWEEIKRLTMDSVGLNKYKYKMNDGTNG